MDPYTSTREQFINGLLERPIPDDASEDWKKYAQNNKDRLKKLAFHGAMRPNLQQTYMTPANSKNKICYMWHFVGRTLGMLYQVSPSTTLQSARGPDQGSWNDVLSRSEMSASLILDEQRGMLDMTITSTFGNTGPTPQFDEETLQIARRLKR